MPTLYFSSDDSRDFMVLLTKSFRHCVLRQYKPGRATYEVMTTYRGDRYCTAHPPTMALIIIWVRAITLMHKHNNSGLDDQGGDSITFWKIDQNLT